MRAQPTRTMGAKRLSNRDSDKEIYGTAGSECGPIAEWQLSEEGGAEADVHR
jgi:hypothetical protein